MKKYLGLSLMMITGLLVSCAGEGYYGPQGRGGWGSMMPYGYGGGMFMWILFIVIVVAVIFYWAVKSTKSKGQIDASAEKPIDILKKRYAKGEITKDEYERMIKDLES